jgi:phosphatidylglycerophosphate synthase
VTLIRRAQAPAIGLLAQLGLLAGLAAGPGLGPAGWLVGVGYALVAWALLSRALRTGARWGPADTVTLARATLVVGVTALVADSFTGPVSVPVLTGLAAVALLLDAVDGQVARRTGTASRHGAQFDMETDSVLVLALSLFVAGALGWWVAILGLPRYLFGVAGWLLPWLRAPMPSSLPRKTVAAAQGVVLVVAAGGVLPRPAIVAAVGCVLAALVWSFGVTVGWLWRSRPGARAPQTVDVAKVDRVRQRPQVRRQLRAGHPAPEREAPALADRYVEAVRVE